MPEPVTAILGATGGIGRALATQLAAAGHTLFLGARGEDRLSALSASLGDAPTRAVDVTDADEVDAFVQAVVARCGRIDGLALCVGSILLKPAHLTSVEDWRATLAVNLDSAFFTVRAGAKAMRRSGGSIVLFSTAAARAGLPNHDAIAAAKGGVTALAQSAAATYASRGIRVNTVAPGLVDTPLAAALVSHEASRTASASASLHALGRIGTADEVARVAAFLLDPRNDWITGQTFGVDGGLATVRPPARI